jgi:hypothetical protein
MGAENYGRGELSPEHVNVSSAWGRSRIRIGRQSSQCVPKSRRAAIAPVED